MTVASGLLRLMRRHAAAAFVGLLPDGLWGVPEVRITDGGAFLVRDLGRPVMASPDACLLAGLSWREERRWPCPRRLAFRTVSC